MEACLAATGENGVLIIGSAVVVIIIGLLLLVAPNAKHRRSVGSVFVLGMMIFSVTASPASHAASAQDICDQQTGNSATAQISRPDTTTGAKGAVQAHNVLLNDTPTPGSEFIETSLQLGLVADPVIGSTLSPDKKVVSAPTEGVYTAHNNGVIQYTPDADFVGVGKGVRYSIADTAGNVTSNSYIPTVTDSSQPPQTCSDTPQLRDINFDIYGPHTVFTSNVANVAPDFGRIDSSADGTRLIGIGSTDYVYISTDSGTSWQAKVANGSTASVSMSDDGQKIATTNYDGVIHHSSDGGNTWTTSNVPDPTHYALITISNDGSKYLLTQQNLTDSGYNVFTSTDGITWQFTHNFTGEYVKMQTMTTDGQTIYALNGLQADYTQATIAKSTDAGQTWTTQLLPTANVNQIAVSADGSKLAYISYSVDNLYLSSDSGASWSIASGTGTHQWDSVSLSADGQTILANDNYNLFLSQNGGSVWSTIGPTENWSNVHVANNGNTLFAFPLGNSLSSRGYRSTNAGATSTQLAYNLGIDQQTVDLDTATPGIQQTYHYNQNGNEWTAVYDPNTDLLSLTFISDSFLYFDYIEREYNAQDSNGCTTANAFMHLYSANS